MFTFSMGGRTMFLSRLFMTILQSCLRILFNTALSQFSAYIDRDPEQGNDDVDDVTNEDFCLTVQEIHERSEDPVSGSSDLRL